MTNLETYDEVFIDCFELVKSQLNDDLVYQSVPNWDSVGHMQMIAGLEDEFDIVFDTDDIIDFSSYAVGKELLKKYDVII